jgi:rubrerythrin
MARTSPSAAVGLQFIVDQVGELYGLEQVIMRIEQDIASRTSLPDVKSHLERFASEDQQHSENLLQALRMMLGSETTVQPAIDRGRHAAEAAIAASQESAFAFVRGLLLLVYQATLAGRTFMQIQQRIENREIIGLLETNHHQDEGHLRYLETQLSRAAEELTGLMPPK